MTRMIDADALLKDIGDEPEVWTDSPEETAERNEYRRIRTIIESQPTIDAVPVKEFCEWLEEHGCNIFKEAFVTNVQLFGADREKGEKK